MNILPHKSWHVRTKKNIARVRKDEAKAAEEEKELQRKISLAAQEARTEFLRQRATQRFDHDSAVAEGQEEVIPKLPVKEEISLVGKSGHVNFFQEIEDGVIQKCKVNLEHEEEKKAEQEDYEKKIGYLTYLGQNSLEQTKEKPWYAKLDRRPSGATSTKSETTTASEKEDDLSKLKETKFKDFHDPLKDIRKYLQTPGVKTRIENVKSSPSPSLSSLVRKRKSSTFDTTKDISDKFRHSSKKNKKPKKVKKEKKHKKSKHHHSSKHKQDKKEKQRLPSSSDSEESTDSDDMEERQKQEKLAKLRADRLEREREERRKAEKLMAKLRGEPIEEEKPPENTSSASHDSGSRVKQKYNSQFNPHLARQNFDN